MTKRKTRESFGAFRVLPSGRIQASYTGLDGKRYNAPSTFDNKTDARGWLSIQQAKLHTGQWSPMDTGRADAAKDARTETLETYATEWLGTRMNRHGEHLRPRTRVEYARLLRTSLSALSGERLKAITPEVIRKWYADQTVNGTRTQAARAYGFLKAVLSPPSKMDASPPTPASCAAPRTRLQAARWSRPHPPSSRRFSTP